ncbi:MAG: hypothetical protein KKC75_06480 [Nanoarchaeota archaeon]|nr:hypothetical protein [Nanoarchaeota archaeon]MBU1005627.1 hypothetical protein [Nanoarchaeota archaeon]MBU1946353.1 hypothetical protein [Nanoarchaeota archaeon]
MVFARITGTIIIIFGLFIGSTYFNLIPSRLFGYDFILIGIILFIVHELHALIMNLSSDGNKIVGVGVPLLFMIISASYFIQSYLPEAIIQALPLIIAAFMLAEGLYRLH